MVYTKLKKAYLCRRRGSFWCLFLIFFAETQLGRIYQITVSRRIVWWPWSHIRLIWFWLWAHCVSWVFPLKLTFYLILTSWVIFMGTSDKFSGRFMGHSRSFHEGDRGTVRPHRSIVGSWARLFLFVFMLSFEPSTSTYISSFSFFLVIWLILPWSWKIDRFIDKLIFGCKENAWPTFTIVDNVGRWPWRSLLVLLASGLWADDSHIIDFRTVRDIVARWTWSSCLLVMVAKLFSHPASTKNYFHDGALMSVEVGCGW